MQVQPACRDTLPWLISFSLNPMMHVAADLISLLPAIMFGGVLLLILGLYFVKRHLLRKEPSLIPADRLFRRIGLGLLVFALILITLLWLFGPR
jgi:hypothetical protein